MVNTSLLPNNQFYKIYYLMYLKEKNIEMSIVNHISALKRNSENLRSEVQKIIRAEKNFIYLRFILSLALSSDFHSKMYNYSWSYLILKYTVYFKILDTFVINMIYNRFLINFIKKFFVKKLLDVTLIYASYKVFLGLTVDLKIGLFS
ncbi:hypothetical protein EDEG_01630 [Edhazardia aedis USNM 41457]|uniref:Uncharacterized protein n=1 Tax=Edhazardia aedis (strain USNM 41457) TaxID=1003232 RepID=J9D9A4_EDHAE|nr:hypothetical protein EDEG_01630 [Edhazardia aedis USNM 41457]|eukprot:EJW04054.1 hypothetical protein EDEG_01630 [Edhazardia aedis USNM 41457]